MRIIAGSARGATFDAPQGRDTRPTLDRVRENVFNILQMKVREARVLDLFSGSGAMAFEAISRGAASAVLVDVDRAANQIERRNADKLRMQDRCRILHCDWQQAVRQLTAQNEKFDLVFLDPPYAGPLMDESLKAIAEIDIVSENGIIVCESSLDKEMPELPAPYEKGREYRYGKIKVTIYRRKA